MDIGFICRFSFEGWNLKNRKIPFFSELRYGKCNYCQIPEGKLMKAAGAMPNPGGVGGCKDGGKCSLEIVVGSCSEVLSFLYTSVTLCSRYNYDKSGLAFNIKAFLSGPPFRLLQRM